MTRGTPTRVGGHERRCRAEPQHYRGCSADSLPPSSLWPSRQAVTTSGRRLGCQRHVAHGGGIPAEAAVDSPTAGGAVRDPRKPVQRRLTRSEVAAVAAEYQHGRSSADLAREFGVHRRTVADHLIRLGIARRVNLPKLPPPDIERAVIKYQAGDSLATVGKALNVDASTVRRALKRAGVAIRPRPGR
jgi:hypothetical protein